MAVRATYRTRSRSYPRGGIAMIFLRSVSDRSRSWIALALIVGALFGLRAADAGAATIVVNTLSDQNNTGPECSLREAILSANADVNTGGCTGSGGYGDDTITVPAGTYTLTTSAQLTVNDTTPNNLVITGAGASTTSVEAATTAGTATWRDFEVKAGSFSVSGLTIRNGRETQGGGIFFDSGSGTSLTIADCEFTGNQAT